MNDSTRKKGKQESKLKGYDNVFATRLRNLIEQANITQGTLAKESGCSRQAISQYMDGSSMPNVDKLLSIADFFGVSTDYLLGREEKKNEKELQHIISDYLGLSEATINIIIENQKRRVIDDNTFTKFIDFLGQNNRVSMQFFGVLATLEYRCKRRYEFIDSFILSSAIQSIINLDRIITEEEEEKLSDIKESLSKVEDNIELSEYRLQKTFSELVKEYIQYEAKPDNNLDEIAYIFKEKSAKKEIESEEAFNKYIESLSPEEYKEYMSEIEVYIHGNNQETQ